MMTRSELISYKENGYKLHKLYLSVLDGIIFSAPEYSYDVLLDKYGPEIVNNEVIYDAGFNMMYIFVTEDYLPFGEQKLLEFLENKQRKIIEEAQKIINLIISYPGELNENL